MNKKNNADPQKKDDTNQPISFTIHPFEMYVAFVVIGVIYQLNNMCF